MRAEPVHTIMTIETGRAERKSVRGHKCGVALPVTRVAGLTVERCDITLMAIVALERSARCRTLVRLQRKSHHLVREAGVLDHSQLCIRSAMLRVAVTTAQVWIIVKHRSVHRGDILHLLGNIRVAGYTAISHPL